jgi:hypothetical protein
MTYHPTVHRMLAIVLVLAGWLLAMTPAQAAPGALAVMVVDMDSQPVANCEVRTFWKGNSGNYYRTKKNGKVTVTNLPAGQPYYLYAADSDLHMAIVVKGPETGKKITLTLKPAGSVEARAKDAKGNAVRIRSGYMRLKADENTTFQISSNHALEWGTLFYSLPEGAYVFAPVLSLDDRVEYGMAKEAEVKVASGKITKVDVSLEPGVLVDLLFQDAKTKKPVAGIRGTLQRGKHSQPGYESLSFRRTHADGVVRARLRPGAYRISLYSQEYTWATPDSQGQFQVGNKPAQKITVALKSMDLKRINGIVIDHKGRPVANARINLRGFQRIIMHHYATGADGTFSARVQPSDPRHNQRMRIQISHRKRNLSITKDIDSIAKTIRIALQPTSIIKGRVVGSDGKPIYQASISARLLIIVPGQRHPQERYISNVYSDKDGRFVIRGVEPGHNLKIHAIRAGYMNATRTVPTTKPGKDGSTTELKDLVLSNLDRKLIGKVVDEDDKPMANVRIKFSGPGAPGASVSSDAEGKFTAMVGKAHLTLNARGLGRMSMLRGKRDINATDTKITLVLKWPATQPVGPNDVTCTILGPDGKPFIGAHARVYSNGGQWGHERSGRNGIVILRHIRQQKNAFAYAYDEQSNLAAIVPITAPDDKMAITLAKGATVTGYVVDAKGNRIRSSSGYFGYRSGDKVVCNIYARRRDQDSFTGTCIPAGSYTVTARISPSISTKLGMPKPTAATIKTDKPQTVTLTLDPGSLAEITITDSKTGKPIAGAYLNLSRRHPTTKNHESYGTTRSDAKGVAKVRLRPGKYQISLNCRTHSLNKSNKPQYLTITAEAKQTHTLAIIPRNIITIKGLVLDGAGKPVAGARVDNYGFHRLIQQDHATRADGTFILKGEPRNVRDKTRCFIRISHARRGLALRVPFPTESTELRLTLLPSTTLTGTIVDAKGKPASGVRIDVSIATKDANGHIIRSESHGRTTTDKDGNFRYGVLDTGATMILKGYKAGYMRTEKTIEVKAADKPGAEQAVGNLVISKLNRKLTGIIVDDGGQPVANTYIAISATNNRHNNGARSDNLGKFSVLTAHGPLRLYVAPKGRLQLTGRLTVAAGKNDVRLVLKPRAGYVQPIPAATRKQAADAFKAWVKGRPEAGKKAVFLCLFNDTNAPSVIAISKLQALAPSYSKDKLSITALAFTTKTDAQLAKWAADKRLKLSILKGGAPADAKKIWGAPKLPLLILFSKDGSIQSISHAYSGVLDKLEVYGQ